MTPKYNPDTKWTNRNYLNGWLAAMLIHKALKNAGRELTPESVVGGFAGLLNMAQMITNLLITAGSIKQMLN